MYVKCCRFLIPVHAWWDWGRLVNDLVTVFGVRGTICEPRCCQLLYTRPRCSYCWVSSRPNKMFTLHVDITYLVTFLLTYSMKQRPSWEANRFSSIQDIPHELYVFVRCTVIQLCNVTNRMHTFWINVLIQFVLSSTCFEYLVFIARKTVLLYMHFYMLCFTCIYASSLAQMHERHTI